MKRTGQRPNMVSSPRRARDTGVSFVEILVAIVLIGTAVVGTLTAVRASVMGSRIEREHAKAHQWLQSASEVVREIPRLGCVTNTPDQIRDDYIAKVRAQAPAPSGWIDPNQITIPEPIRFWDGEQYLPAQCFETDRRYLQLVTLQVTNPDGVIIEVVQVVKHA